MADDNYINTSFMPEFRDCQPMPADNYASAITLLQECYAACQKALAFNPLPKTNANLPPTYLKHLNACSEVCEFTANMLLKGKAGTGLLCDIATRVCGKCADSCEKAEEPHIKSIAELCRKTAAACFEENHEIGSQAA
jgi:hypothetical protein